MRAIIYAKIRPFYDMHIQLTVWLTPQLQPIHHHPPCSDINNKLQHIHIPYLLCNPAVYQTSAGVDNTTVKPLI